MTTTGHDVMLASSISKYGGGLGGLIIVLALAFAASYIAKSKGRSNVVWFIIGLIFPLLGLIVVLILPRKN